MKLRALTTLAVGLCLFCVMPGRTDAASARFTPSLDIGYHWNDNIESIDRDKIDPISAQWLDYMVGVDASVKSNKLSFALGGHAGFSEYINTSTNLNKLTDMRIHNLNYANLDLTGDASYTTRSMAFEIDDILKRNRQLSDIFGFQNSDFSD